MSSETMLRRILAVFAMGGAALATACDPSSIFGGDCADVGYYAVTLTIRDPQGHAQALGATVTLVDGSYSETDTPFDTLMAYGAEERGNRTYDIHVTKPFYGEVWVRGVRAPRLGCGSSPGSSPILVPIVLSLAPNAPVARSIHLLPNGAFLDRGRQTTFTFATVVDANPGVSRAITWSITGDTASVGLDSATGLLTYRCRATSGHVTVTASLVANPSISGSADLTTQGHPAATGDPPCS